MKSEFWDLFEVEPEHLTDQDWQQRLCQKALDVFAADGVSLFLAQNERTYFLASAVGLSRDIPVDAMITRGEGLAGRAADSGKATLVSNADIGAHRANTLASAMILPLISRGRCVALMNITRAKGREPFGRASVMASRAVSRYLGAAIANAQNAEDLKERERLKRLAQAGQMTASLAHEIRNPLTTVIAAAQAIRSDPGSALDLAEMIEHEALRLNRLCDELLDFSKVDLLRLEVLDIDGLCDDVIRAYQPQYDQKGVRLEHLARSVSLPVDRGRFEQVLGNLLRNALEATPSGGHVVVACDHDSVTISDSGSGIDPDVEKTLFEPFFTTKACGTGLGLPNVKRWVEAHGWSIVCNCSREGGAEFQIRFNQRKAA